MNILRKFKFKLGKLFKGENVVPIISALKTYKKNPCTGFHIPGHNRGNSFSEDIIDLFGSEIFKVDSTDEFDNLGTLLPESGAIGHAQELASNVFNSKKTFFITTGSTTGNLAIGLGIINPGDKVLIGRNCHRSVITSLILTGANPTWLIPKKLEDWEIYGACDPNQIEETLKKNKGIKLIWITNPTYEGVVSDIKEISKICKKYDVILAVDEAHGALWNFSDKLPTSALEDGADIVVHSIHKTAGSMVQSSMVHISKTSKINPNDVESALKLVHTTSPSMVLLASLDSARANLSSKHGQKLINKAIENAKFLKQNLKNIKNISILSEKQGIKCDPTKIFLKIENLKGKHLEAILKDEFHIEVESAYDEGILILSNIGGKKEEFEYLINALKEISKRNYEDIENNEKLMPMLDPKILMLPRDAYFSPQERVKKEDSIGKICTEIIAFCPPGISILLPGELITKEHIPYLSDKEFVDVLKI